MPLSMYDASAPVFLQMLKALDGVLDKAISFAAAKKLDPSVMPGLRLAADMLSLARQVQISSDWAVRGMSRLAGVEPPSIPDEEKTLEQLKERIAKAIAIVEAVKPEQLAGSETRDVTFGIGGGKTMTAPGSQYLFHVTMPNFYFHVTAAYAILRHNGVEIGKRDFLGPVL